jgi:hypothetical protein
VSDNVRDEQLSYKAQQRKSIDDYKLCWDDFEEALLAIKQMYRKLAQGPRSVTSALFKGKLAKSVPGFKTITSEFNMDPKSYSMTVINCTIRLARYHNLSLPELHSLQMAFQVLPHTCMFFGVASKMLL